MTWSVDHANDLGRVIQRLRGKRTQSELAEAANLRPSTWSEYERGRRLPRGRNMARVAAALGIDVRALEKEVLEVGRQRLTKEGIEAALPSAALLETADRMLRWVDSGLAELLELRNLLFALRQQLLAQERG